MYVGKVTPADCNCLFNQMEVAGSLIPYIVLDFMYYQLPLPASWLPKTG